MGKKVKKDPKKRQFSVYFDSELCDRIDEQARTEERSTNFIIERCVKKLEKYGFNLIGS